MKTSSIVTVLALVASTSISAQAALLYQEAFEGSLSAGFNSPATSFYTPSYTSDSPQVTQGVQAYLASSNQTDTFTTILAISNTGVTQAFRDAFVEGSVLSFDAVGTGLGDAGYVNLQFTRYDGADASFLNLAETPYNQLGVVLSVSYTVTAVEALRFATSPDYKLEFQINSNATLPGTFSIDNLQINGTAPIPEPAAYATVAGVAFLGWAAWRRRRA
jgi:hypothetical protein